MDKEKSKVFWEEVRKANLTANQKLDIVLGFYKIKRYNTDYDKDNVIWNKLKNEAFFGNSLEFTKYVEWLEMEDYIERTNNALYITPKGLSFIGFEQTEINAKVDADQNNAIKKYDFLTKEFVWKWRYLTWILSSAALIVAVISCYISYKNYTKATVQESSTLKQTVGLDSIQSENKKMILQTIDSLMKLKPTKLP